MTKADLLEAIASGSDERIQLALIDASRCLEDNVVYAHAVALLHHPSATVRWGAVFALDQCRMLLVDVIRDWQLSDTEHPPHLLLGSLAARDADPAVRAMAVDTLVDLIGAFALRLPADKPRG